MPEFLTNFSNQITDYWNKFSRTQKIQIIAIVIAGLTALVVLTLVLSRTDYRVYREDVAPNDMNKIITALNEAQIDSQLGDNGTTILVDATKYDEATLKLADAGVLPSDGLSYQDYFENLSLTMSTSDKAIMAKLAKETKLAEYISAISVVENANVSLVVPLQKSSLLKEDKKASASIWLDLNADLTEDQIFGIASMMESSVENLSTDDIKIFDRSSNKLLFNGTSKGEGLSGISTQMEAEQTMESLYANEIEMLLLNGGNFNDAVVSVNLTMDFDQIRSTEEIHSLPVGLTESLPTRVYELNQSGTNTEGGGIPGTDSNSDTTQYLIDSGSGSENSTVVREVDYAVNRQLIETAKSVGQVNTAKSAVSITVTRYNEHNQALLEANGLLEEITWEQYQADNSASIPLEIDATIVESVANYALLNVENVVIMGNEIPRFIDKPLPENQIADYIPVIIIVLMIALLGYAVYKGTEPVEITEVEPELSVEDMLATTKVKDELETIEFDDKSEARVQIEKFVEENPEAVAQLLRNWLNEDWE